jgi:hypothetical protein
MGLTSSLKSEFPKINDNNYQHTSQATVNYNCIAWAARDNKRWWEPDSLYTYYWPPGVKREYTLEAYQDAYRTVGYEVCDNGTMEKGYEKIVIYIHPVSSMPMHASRLLPSGMWTSKLGQNIDISHLSADTLEGKSYGIARYFMKRKMLNLWVS